MAELDSIWDLPVENSPVRRRDNTAPKRSTLFLASDSEDEAPRPPVSRSNNAQGSISKPDIDALFDDLDEEPGNNLDFAPSLDVNALRREADTRNAKLAATQPKSALLLNEAGDASKGAKKSDKDGDKKRKPLPKLDEARLLSSQGFPALIKEAKNFKPRGKGHETSDLNRVLTMYQFWTQRMYPKMQFRDTVQRVEKLCHSKRMQVALSVWRDEAKGLINGRHPDDPIDLTSDSEQDASDREGDIPAKQSTPSTAGPATPNGTDSPPTRLPSSIVKPTTAVADSDFDIDAMIDEDQQRLDVAQAQPPGSSPPSTNRITVEEDDDDDMWKELDAGFDYSAALDESIVAPSEPANRAASKNASTLVDDDEDMWDIVREMEMEASRAREPQVSMTPAGHDAGEGQGGKEDTPPRPTNDEGWDDMYL